MQQMDPRVATSNTDFDITGRNRKRNDRWYYLAFEGDTEFNYFGIVRDNKKKLGIGDNIGCIRLYRFDDEKDNTDPKWIKDEVEAFKNGLIGRYTPKLFLKQVLVNFREKAIREIADKNKNENYYKLCDDLDTTIHEIEENLLEELESEEYYVDDSLFDTSEAFNLIRKTLMDRFRTYKTIILFRLINPADKRLTPEDLSYDRFCVIVDRDYYSDIFRLGKNETYSEYYANLIDYFKGSDISLYVTNPAFEFWLIMHFDDIKYSDEEMLINAKDHTNKRYAERVLADHLAGYRKNALDAEPFVGSSKDCKPIKTAIREMENKGYSTSLESLKNNLGSNLGLLIKEMQNPD